MTDAARNAPRLTDATAPRRSPVMICLYVSRENMFDRVSLWLPSTFFLSLPIVQWFRWAERRTFDDNGNNYGLWHAATSHVRHWAGRKGGCEEGAGFGGTGFLLCGNMRYRHMTGCHRVADWTRPRGIVPGTGPRP